MQYQYKTKSNSSKTDIILQPCTKGQQLHPHAKKLPKNVDSAGIARRRKNQDISLILQDVVDLPLNIDRDLDLQMKPAQVPHLEIQNFR